MVTQSLCSASTLRPSRSASATWRGKLVGTFGIDTLQSHIQLFERRPLFRVIFDTIRHERLCLRRDGVDSLVDLFQRISNSLSPSSSSQQDECADLFMRLMEFLLLVLARAAQVRVGLWRRNGPGSNDQVLNYAEPPFCRTMRDADFLLVEFAVLGRRQGLHNDNDSSSSVGMVYFVHLLLHKLGIFDFCGLLTAPSQDIPAYLQEAQAGFYDRELPLVEPPPTVEGGGGGTPVVLPWTYTPSRELASSLVLLEEFLRLLIVFASELPHPSPADKAEHTEQARWRLHREVVHRLASGPKTHSELLEVHHVLSHWDNLLLSEEGKEVNPDDATGAALGTVLSEVADRKISRGKLEPDKWEMRKIAWDSYDPSFFHISVRMRQGAADSRPKPKSDPAALFGWNPKPYSPEPFAAHPFFTRLRRDVTADATVVAILYRVLHMHLRSDSNKDTSSLPGHEAYEKEKSETSLARVIHLLALGVFAWKNASSGDTKPTRGFQEPSIVVASIASARSELAPKQDPESKWTKTCLRLLELALSNRPNLLPSASIPGSESFTLEAFKEASSAALFASCEFLSYTGSILPVLVPGVLVSYESTPDPVSSLKQTISPMETFERLRFFLKLEHVDEILTSPLTQEIVANWYDDAVRLGRSAVSEGRSDSSTQQALRARLKKSQGFRDQDWPSAGSTDENGSQGQGV